MSSIVTSDSKATQGFRSGQKTYLTISNLSVSFGEQLAVKGVDLSIKKGEIVSFIGPSGCGKTTVLRSINRMAETQPGFTMEGSIVLDNDNIYSATVDPVLLRRKVGMVFQKANPYPTSIYDNVAWGLKIQGIKDNLDQRVEQALVQAVLWDDVKDRLKSNAMRLSGGQQQRLCIARALALEPAVLLLDEPTSALDPVTTRQIEDLIYSLKEKYTIIMASHNLNQAARLSDAVAFFTLDEHRHGYLETFDQTINIFFYTSNAKVESYIKGHTRVEN